MISEAVRHFYALLFYAATAGCSGLLAYTLVERSPRPWLKPLLAAAGIIQPAWPLIALTATQHPVIRVFAAFLAPLNLCVSVLLIERLTGHE